MVIEEEMKEEMKEDVDPHSGADDGEWKCLLEPSPPRVSLRQSEVRKLRVRAKHPFQMNSVWEGL